jgi:PhoH-like ATPase
VFLSDPNALFNYPNELVVIPISVIEEIDEFKKSLNELGRNARHILRKLDKLRKRGKISSQNPKSKRSKKSLPGIALNNGGRLIIELNHTDSIPEGLSKDKVDNRILAVSIFYKNKYPDSDVELITKDANLRIKADSFDVKASDYEKATDISSDSIYKGYQNIILDNSDYLDFQKNKALYYVPTGKKPIQPNEFVKLTNGSDDCIVLLGRYNIETEQIVSLGRKELKELVDNWKIEPTNEEQQMALDALLNPAISLVTISGKAGTGKTLLAVLAGLYLAFDKDYYDKVLISRPVMPMGKDIGYLPGSIDEKLSPWMQPIFDNLEYLFEQGKNGSMGAKFTKSKKNETYTSYEDMLKDGKIKVEPLMFIRGRSIPKQFIIVDEAQNLSLHEMKTIITRAGKGTKIVFTGDPEQIDNPYVDGVSNGLTQIIERLKDERLTAHVHLSKGERSELADIVSDKLR